MKLKPCPFCNSEATVWSMADVSGNIYVVECDNEKCGCTYGSNMSLTFEQAIKMWNKRPKEK